MATLDKNKALRAVKTIINRGDGTGFPLAAKRQIRNALDKLAGKAEDAGAGLTSGTGTIVKSGVERTGELVKTTILLDLTGLNSAAQDLDIIGVDGTTDPCFFTRIDSEVNGTLVQGWITCLETPAGGDPNIAFYHATEGTGVHDTLISALTETITYDRSGDWAALDERALTNIPASGQYLYLVQGDAVGTNATYTAGQFLVELWGYVA